MWNTCKLREIIVFSQNSPKLTSELDRKSVSKGFFERYKYNDRIISFFFYIHKILFIT